MADSNAKAGKNPQTNTSEARQVVDIFQEISTLLNAELDRRTLSVCISLLESGVNPEALATVIRGLRKDKEEIEKKITEGGGGEVE